MKAHLSRKTTEAIQFFCTFDLFKWLICFSKRYRSSKNKMNFLASLLIGFSCVFATNYWGEIIFNFLIHCATILDCLSIILQHMKCIPYSLRLLWYYDSLPLINIFKVFKTYVLYNFSYGTPLLG